MWYSRWTSVIGFLICIALLAIAAYLQQHLGLLPCPLCVVQRLLFLILAFIFLSGSIYTPHERWGRRIQSFFIIATSIAGAAVAGRHVWLTWQPPSASNMCSPTLGYLLRSLSFPQAMHTLFSGSADCARETCRLMGLTIPEWTFLLFSVFALLGMIRFVVAKSK